MSQWERMDRARREAPQTSTRKKLEKLGSKRAKGSWIQLDLDIVQYGPLPRTNSPPHSLETIKLFCYSMNLSLTGILLTSFAVTAGLFHTSLPEAFVCSQSSRVLQAVDLDQTCRDLESVLTRASCDCSETSSGYAFKCYWHDQFCDEEGNCACLTTLTNYGSDLKPVDGMSCADYNNGTFPDFCTSLTFCGDIVGNIATLCGCEVQVGGGSEKCNICEACNNGLGVNIDCDSIMPGQSTNGTCMPLDDDFVTEIFFSMQTNDGQCTSSGSTAPRVTFATVILVLISTFW